MMVRQIGRLVYHLGHSYLTAICMARAVSAVVGNQKPNADKTTSRLL